jgi:glutamyl/glutaminyl-tRNA synthetase
MSPMNWRFRVPDGEAIEFADENMGPQRFVAGRDFGDFLVWRKDGMPSYELAVVADDIAMGITEVVRGEDLLLSTARQLLIYRALGREPPRYYHCPLVLDENGADLRTLLE